MSREVDERVVSMQFDNKKFEANAATTMSTLDKLKEKLNFKGAEKSFDQISDYASRVDLSSMERSASAVEVKFNAMSMFAIAAIERIVNKAADAGEKLIKSLTIEPISDGWNKYAEKTSSVQTIMAATAKEFDDVGEQMEVVNGQLESLMWFTDETSYSFNDMVSNIGKFTSQDIPLDKAVVAMKGIANWAAISGANTQEASRAMYNLSQSLGTGSVRLIDWKSIENANMATAEFKEMVINAALAEGSLKKVSDGLYETMNGNEVSVANFNDALKDGWFTSNVLMKTLDKYGGAVEKIEALTDATGKTASQVLDLVDEYIEGGLDMKETAKDLGISEEILAEAMADLSSEEMQFSIKTFRAAQEAKTFKEAIDSAKEAVASGWSKTFEMVFGDYLTAKKIWTGLANTLYEVFASSAEARNDMLKDWAEAHGREEMLKGITVLWENLCSVVNAVKKALHEVFPPLTGAALANMTKRVREFLETLTPTEEALKTIKVAVKLLLVPIKAFVKITQLGIIVIGKMVSALFKLINAVIALPSKVELAHTSFEEFIGTDRYERFTKALSVVVGKLANAFAELHDWIDAAIHGIGQTSKVSKFLQASYDILSPIAGWILDRIIEGLEFIGGLDWHGMLNTVEDGLSNIWDWFGKIIDRVSGLFSTIRGNTNGSGLSSMVEMFGTLGTNVKNLKLELNLSKSFDKMKANAFGLGTAFGNMGDNLEQFTSKIDPAKMLVAGFGVALTAALGSITGVMTAAKGTFASITTVFKQLTDNLKAAKPSKYEKVALAILALAGALVVMSMVDSEGLKQATKSMLELMAAFTIMMAGMAAIDKFLLTSDGIESKMAGISTTMILLAGAMLMMATSLSVLSKVDPEGIGKKLLALAGAMVILGAFSVAMAKFVPTMTANSVSILAFSGAVLLVVHALEKLEKVKLMSVSSAMGTLVVVMGLMATASSLSGKATFKGAVGMVLSIVALLAMIKILKKLSEVDFTMIIKGLLPMIPLMATLIIVSKSTSKASQYAVKAGIAAIAIAGATLILVETIDKLGAIPKGQLAKGTVAAIAVMGMFAIICKSLSSTSQYAAKAGITVALMSTAMLILASCIEIIGSLTAEQVFKGTAAVSALLGMFALIIKSTENSKKAGATILAMTAAIGILSAALALLAYIPSEQLIPAMEALGGGLLAFAAAIRIMGDVNFKKALGVVLMMSAFLIAFKSVSKLISGLKSDASSQNLLAFAGVITSLAFVIDLLGNVKISSAANLAPIILGMAAFIAAGLIVVAALNSIEIQPGLLEKVGAFAGIIAALVGVTAILGKIDTNIAFVLDGLKGLALVCGVVGVLLVAMGAILKLDGVEDLMANGVRAFGLIGQAIGTFVGSVLGSLVGSAIGSAAISLADSLNTFAEKIGEFFNTMSGVNQTGVSSLKYIGEALLYLTAAELVAGIGRFVGKKDMLTKFGKDLAKFSPYFKDFVSDINNTEINALKINAASQAMTAAADLVNAIPGGLSVKTAWNGIKSLKDFGQDLKDFAPLFKAYVEEIGTVSIGDTYENTIAAAKSVAEFANLTPKKDGILQAITGTSSTLGIFGQQLKDFAPKFADYAKTMGGVDTSVVTKSASAAKSLAEFANNLPESGGKWQDWFGTKETISGFGAKLVSFGTGFNSYAKSISDMPDNAAEKTAIISDAMSYLISMANDLGTSGGLLSSLFGEKSDIGSFGDNLKAYGEGVVSFYETIANIDVSFSEQMTNFYNAGSDLMNYLMDGIESKNSDLKMTAKSIVAIFLMELNNNEVVAQFKAVGEQYVTGLNNGVTNTKRILIEAINALGESALEALKKKLDINSPSKETYKIGRYVVEGLANGIKDDEGSLLDRIRTMGGNLVQALKEKLGIHSPSVVFKNEVGVYIVRGIAEGIKSDMSAEEAAKQKADNIKKAFQKELDGFKLDLSTVDKELALWSALNPNANDADKTQHEIDALTGKLQNEGKMVANLEAQWKAAVKQFGADSDQTQEFYNAYIDEKTAMANMASQLIEARKTLAETQSSARKESADAMVAYATLMAENRDVLLEQGFALEEIEKWARDTSGYGKAVEEVNEVSNVMAEFGVNINDVVIEATQNVKKTAVSGAKSATKAAMDASAETFEEEKSGWWKRITSFDEEGGKGFQEAMGSSVTNVLDYTIDGWDKKISGWGSGLFNSFKEDGESAIDGLKEGTGVNSPSWKTYETAGFVVQGFINGLNDGREAVYNSVVGLGEYTVNQFDLLSSYFHSIGENIDNGISLGMEQGIPAVEAAARAVASAALTAAMSALSINSPSKEFEKLGKFSDMGFAKGLTKYASVAERASVSMGEDTISSLRKSIDNISSYVSSNIDYNPSITPVLDFSEIQNGLVMMDGMLQNSRAVNLVGTISKAQSAANSMNYRDDNFGAAQPAVVNNTFTQNNYSPKALSRLDIYRQTKNQFAAAKGRVTTR